MPGSPFQQIATTITAVTSLDYFNHGLVSFFLFVLDTYDVRMCVSKRYWFSVEFSILRRESNGLAFAPRIDFGEIILV